MQNAVLDIRPWVLLSLAAMFARPIQGLVGCLVGTSQCAWSLTGLLYQPETWTTDPEPTDGDAYSASVRFQEMSGLEAVSVEG